ncbi:hypothetical protein CAP36_04990 [Chitinophagaceae bacterium IBVUCB2]|nr:hypothetical protein CAP36_04990 [Chitinophagaceae bacterium IBVUCB2]
MKMNLKLWSGISAFVFLLASCGSTAHIEKDDNTDFSRYKTFAWVDKDENGKRGSDLTEQKMRDAVNKELEKTSGWREVKNRPDVLLSYDVLVERSVRQDNNPVYSNPTTRVFYNPRTRRYVSVYYPSQFLGYDRDQREVKEGTVTISMIDAKTDKTVWQGWTTDEVRNRNLTSKEIQTSVKSIFRKFDIAKN